MTSANPHALSAPATAASAQAAARALQPADRLDDGSRSARPARLREQFAGLRSPDRMPDSTPLGGELDWSPDARPERAALRGSHVVLRPLGADDADALYVVSHAPDGDPA